MKTKVSILMPVKNAENYLSECLDSISQQSFQDWELVAVDDHSDDNSLELLRNFACIDPRIVVLQNEGQGIIQALRMAFNRSTGAFITRMDADDRMSSRKIEEMAALLSTKKRGYLVLGLVSYFSESPLGDGYRKYADWLNHLTINESNFDEIYKECSIPSPCWMVDRWDLMQCGDFSLNVYPEDYDLAFRFRKHRLKVIAVPKVLHSWRDHPDRASRNDPNYLDNKFSALKVMHFLDQDRQIDRPLILWGAGKKGKAIASALNDHDHSFLWCCNNERKVGKDVYGIRLSPTSLIDAKSPSQIIMAVSGPQDQEQIKKQIARSWHQYYWFC